MMRRATTNLLRLVRPQLSALPPPSGGFTGPIAEHRLGLSSWSGDTHLPRQLASSGGFTRRRGLSTWLDHPDSPCPCCGRFVDGRMAPEITADRITSRSNTYGNQSMFSGQPLSSLPSGVVLPEQPRVLRPSDMLFKFDRELGPFELEYFEPIKYFMKKPILARVAPDSSNKMLMLLPQSPPTPWRFTESGKFSMHSMKGLVTGSHKEGRCLGPALNLGNLSVSSLGSFKLNDLSRVGEVSFDIAGQLADFTTLHHVKVSLLKELHGDAILGDLPADFGKYLNGLLLVKDPEVESYVIECNPTFLPASTYAVAFLKMHGFFMEEGGGLMYTDGNAAVAMLARAPYIDDKNPLYDWVQIAKSDPWLNKWMRSYYDVKKPRHILIYPRNLFSHRLAYRHCTATSNIPNPAIPGGPLGKNSNPVTPYSPEAVSVLSQYRLPLLLPFLVRTAYDHCLSHSMSDEIDSWGLDKLFCGVSPCYVR